MNIRILVSAAVISLIHPVSVVSQTTETGSPQEISTSNYGFSSVDIYLKGLSDGSRRNQMESANRIAAYIDETGLYLPEIVHELEKLILSPKPLDKPIIQLLYWKAQRKWMTNLLIQGRIEELESAGESLWISVML